MGAGAADTGAGDAMAGGVSTPWVSGDIGGVDVGDTIP